MKIIKVNSTHGPNYWSVRRHKLIVILLDLEELEHKPTDKIEGFLERIKNALPGLYEHRCCEGMPGGFFSRVKDGTWMGHVIEHIAIELQVMAGLDVGFGRTRSTGKEGEYHVVFDCEETESGYLTAERAVQIAQELVDGTPPDIETHVKDIQETRHRYRSGPSTASILDEAQARGIPQIMLEDSSTHQLGYGSKQKKFAATITSQTSNIAVDIACNKAACRRLFKDMRIPVADGGLVYSKEELQDIIDDIGFPLVVKPVSGNQGRGVTTHIQTQQGAEQAFKNAAEISSGVIVERHIDGSDFRLLTVDHALVAAAKRTPAHVIGDGSSTIKELIQEVNNDPMRGEGHAKMLTKLVIGTSARSILKKKGYKLGTVLKKDELLDLDHAANLSKGGTAKDVTDSVHPKIAAMATRISKVVGLDICGIDIMASSLEEPLSESGGVVLEVNAAPGFRMHLAPSEGRGRNVAAPVLDMLFPNPDESRIPIIAVTGTNGKTTTTRLLSHILKGAGRNVGYTTTDGIYIDEQLMMTGDCGGPKSAEFVLKDPTVDTAVLECARGGILRSGLGFDRCDAAIVTNITSDHLGLKGIDTLEKMARVKSVVPESVHKNGYAILNAEDDRVYAMKDDIVCEAVLFSINPENPRVDQHREKGGICAVYKDRTITLWDGNETHVVEDIDAIPLSFEGRAHFMIENILAAVAAAYTQKISLEDIRKGLKSFIPSVEQTPGRMNMFSFDDYEIMVDYAHNAAGMKGLRYFIDNSDYSQTIGIISAIGDRRDEDNMSVGRLAADIFDHVIIREDSDRRGKKPGELTAIIKKGISLSDHTPEVSAIADQKEALSHAMEHAASGALIVLCADNIDEAIAFVKEKQAILKKNPSTLKSTSAH